MWSWASQLTSQLFRSFISEVSTMVAILVTTWGFCENELGSRTGEHLVSGPGPSLVAQKVKNLPAMQQTQVQCLAWEDPLEKGIATRSSVLAWEIPSTETPGGLQSMGSQRVRHN